MRWRAAESYEALALHAYGPWAQTAVVAVVAALTWMASVAYLVLMTDMIEPLVEELPASSIGRHGVTMAAGAGLPLCLLRSLHACASRACCAWPVSARRLRRFKSFEPYARRPPSTTSPDLKCSCGPLWRRRERLAARAPISRLLPATSTW